MATVWHNRAMHSAVAEGFLKTGQTNAFNRTDDNHICREARAFWDDLHMWRRHDEVIHDIDVEFNAGRIAWNYNDVASIILPYPRRGQQYDVVHSDEGSEPADADAADRTPPTAATAATAATATTALTAPVTAETAMTADVRWVRSLAQALPVEMVQRWL